MNSPRLMIAGTHSGSGKTTVSLALMSAFTGRGLSVQPYKVGPDYIDSAYHAAATGSSAQNLDLWLMGEKPLIALFYRHTSEYQGKRLALIEGVMGLFDGIGTTATASSAHIADLLDCPAVLVVDASGISLSAAALVSGYAHFSAPPLSKKQKVHGIILNRVSGQQHYELLRKGIEDHTGIPCFGYFPKNAVPSLPSRHLGLVTASEQKDLGSYFEQLSRLAQEYLDLDGLLHLADSPLAKQHQRFSHDMQALPKLDSTPGTVRIAYAKDEAFSFYYQDNLDLLRELGAELIACSPIHDKKLPDGVNGMYLGGGFPEVYAAELEKNIFFREDVLHKLQDGLPAYAECGGMLYLCSSLTVRQGHTQSMVGFFQKHAEMTSKLQNFGYVTVAIQEDCLLGAKGTSYHAHEFHYSRLADNNGDRTQHDGVREGILHMRKQNGRGWTGGMAAKNVFACYPHLHFRGFPQLAENFMRNCKQAAQRSASS